jgi:hypothetical protein
MKSVQIGGHSSQARELSVLGFALVEESDLTLEALAWRCFRAAAADSLFNVTAVVMASCDALDARGISCMAVSGMLAAVADEQTRVGDGVWAIQLAAALLTGHHQRVAVLAWEKPEDFSSGLMAMRGDPHYQRPIGWTAGIEESLLRSMATGGARHARNPARATDRAACIVFGRAQDPTGISLSIELRRGAVNDSGDGVGASIEMPVASPVEPLARIISAIGGLGQNPDRQRTLLVPTADRCHFEVKVAVR